jgi:tetratricopeptide (TPR) repeat protein
VAHWLDKVVEILQADTADLRQLALLAGGDPDTFYRHTRLSDVDVGAQNIAGMEFKGGRIYVSVEDDDHVSVQADSINQFTPEAEFSGQKPDMEDYLSRAERHLRVRDYGRALNVLSQAIGLFPDEPVFWKMQATAHRRTKNQEALIDLLEGAYRRFPYLPWVVLQYAHALIGADRIDLAIIVIRNQLGGELPYAERFELHQALARADRLESIAVLNLDIDRMQKGSERTRFSILLAEQLFNVHRIEEAMDIIRGIDSDGVKGSRNKFFQLLANGAAFEDAQEEVMNIVRKNVDEGRVGLDSVKPFIEGITRLGQQKVALNLLEDVIRQFPLTMAPRKWLADLLEKMGRSQEAINVLMDAVAAFPGSQAPFRALISQFIAMGDIDEAVRLVVHGAEHNGMYFPPKYLRKFQRHSAMYPSVLRMMEGAIRSFPSNYGFVAVYAHMLGLAGQGSLAASEWAHLASMIKDDEVPAWIGHLIASDAIAFDNKTLRERFVIDQEPNNA